MENGISSIGNYAFYGCESLTTMTLPDSITRIGIGAFRDCTALTGALIIPDSTTEIGQEAFYNCNALNGTLTLPNGPLKNIGDRAFYNCYRLSGNLTLPDSITYLGYHAFCKCKGFTGSLTIPAGLTDVKDYAFRGCSGLNGTVTIPEGVTSIGHYAFEGCTKLTGNLVIPDSVTEIGNSAFYGCSGLNGTLPLPDGLTTIGSSAFYECSGLTGALVIPDSVTEIGISAFYGCSGLNGTLTISKNMTKIPTNAFYGCGFTGTLTIPGNITTIDRAAFFGLKNLNAELVLNEGLEKIDQSAFENSKITGDLRIPESVLSIEYAAFSGCSYTSGKVYIPSAVTAINATNSVTLGAPHTIYGKAGSKAEEFAAKTYITFIEDTAEDTDTYWRVIFRDSKDKNSSGALRRVLNNTTIQNPETPTRAGYRLDGWYLNGTKFDFTTPITSHMILEAKWVVDKTTEFTGSCGENATWTLQNGILTISGTGTVTVTLSSKLNDVPIEQLVIGEGITAIGDGAFSSMDIRGELNIPAGVTSIGNSAFAKCSGLTGMLDIPAGVTTIDDNAFAYCSGLTGALTIPDNVATIGRYAFHGCSGLDGALTLPGGLTSISDSAFRDCSGLTGKLNIPVGVTVIEDSAFNNCKGLTGTLDIPKSVTMIGNYAFLGCEGMSGSLVIPAGVTSIGTFAFADCEGFNGKLVLPDSVTEIDQYAFNGCRFLRGELVLPRNITVIYNGTFQGCNGFTGKLIIPNRVTSIGAYAFDCDSLNGEAVIPASVTNIGQDAFAKNVLHTIYGTKGSYAETYARNNAITFIADGSGGGEPGGGDTEEPDEPEGILPGDEPEDGIIPEGFWIAGLDDETYTGKAVKPDVRVYDKDRRLKEKVDYTVAYKNNVKANDASNIATAPTVTVTGKGNYSGKETAVFKILQRNIAGAEAADIILAYNGKEQKKVPVVKIDGRTLKNKTDYELTYLTTDGAYKEPGTYPITITGKTNYSGQTEVLLTITKKNLISKVSIKAVPAQKYDGKEVTPPLVVNSGKLKAGTDYTVSYSNNVEISSNTEAKTATATITGMGDYIGTKTVSFKITGTAMNKAKIEDVKASYEYTGSAIVPAYKVTITENKVKRTLTEGVNYTAAYVKNTQAGTATIVLTGIHDFSGTLKKTFKITPYDAGSGESSGLAVQQNIRIAYAKGGAQPMPRVMCGNTTLVYGRDYTLKYTNNRTVNDGTNPKKRPTMTVTAKGNYKGKQTAYFTIAPQDIGSLSITAADKVASTKPNKYQSTPKAVDIDGKALAKGTDYEKVVQYTYAERTELADGTIREKDANVEATDIQKVGTRINVTVTGRNNYVGTLTGEYRIIKADIAKAKVVIPPQEFTGNAVRPDKSRITITIGKDTIPADSYEIIGYSNNVKKGTATIILQGTKEYGGIRKATFKIQSKGLAWWEKK